MISLWTFFRLVGGEANGSQHHQPTGSKGSGVYRLVGSIPLIFPSCWGFQYLQDSSKVLLSVSLEREPGPCPKHFTTVLECFSLVSHSFPPLSIRLNLFLGTHKRSWRLNETYSVIKKWETQKGFCAEEPHRILLGTKINSRT